MSFSCHWLGATALIPALLPAQDPHATRAPAAPVAFPRVAFATPIHTAPDDPAGGRYGTWAAGTDYKVSFHGDPTFVPYLGRDYPRPQSLRWRTREIRAGGKVLRGETDIAARGHTDWRYEYRFGSVTEAYDVRAEGLEQTFVVHQDPGSPGDLVVRGRLATELTAPEFAGAHRAIAFADAQGRELVRYGAATVVDAAGRRAAIATSYDDGEVALTVPAAWLAKARYPVTIDPLLAATALQLGTAPAESADLARDDDGNQLLMVYTRFIAAGDADAWGRLYPDAWGGGGAGTLVFSDITATWSTPTAACAAVGPEDKLVIAISREFAAVTGAAIRVWAEPRTTAAVVTTVLYGPYAADTIDWRPEVGGIEAFDENGLPAAGSHALVVFQRDDSAVAGTNTAESEVHGLLVDCSTTPATLGAAFEIGSAAADLDAELPDVTKVSEGEEGGDDASWIVVYQEYSNAVAGDDWDIKGKRVDATAAVSGTYTTSDNSGEHRLAPKVAGQRGRYLIFYGRHDEAALGKVSGYQAEEIFSERFSWPAGGAITNGTQRLIASSAAIERDLVVDDVAYDADTDSFWVGAYRDPGDTGELRFTRVGYTGRVVETVVVAPAPDLIDAACDYDDDGNRFVVLYGTDAAAASNPLVGRVFGFPTEVAPSVEGVSCSAGVLAWQANDQDGTMIAPNNQQIGHQFTGVHVNNIPPGALMVMLISLAPADLVVPDPAVAPGCMLLVDPTPPAYLGMTDFRFGPDTFWALPLPEFLSPATLHFQVWHIDPVTGLFNSTTRLEVPIVK